MELWTALYSPLGLAVTAGVILLAYLIYSTASDDSWGCDNLVSQARLNQPQCRSLSVSRFACAPYQILKQHGIKGPRPLPFFGNYRDIKKLGIQKFYEELYKKYGPVSGYYLGQRSNILLVDPEIMKQIAVKEFNSFVEREQFPNFLDDGDHNTPVGLDQAKGEAWRRGRQILSPTFSASKMKAMVPLVKNSADTLVEKLGEFAESGKSVEVLSTYKLFTMETILATAFGRVIDIQRGEADELTKASASLSAAALEGGDTIDLILVLLSNFPFLIHMSRFMVRWLLKENTLEVLRKTALSLVKARREEGKLTKHKDLLQLMIDAAEGEGGEEKTLTDEEIVANSIVFLLAGNETTANTLAYTSYLLALHPEIQEKLQAEIDEYFESKPEASMYEATQELHYLDMVVQESLRMYPPVPRTSRLAEKTIEINGVTIPKGVTVQFPIYLIQHDPNFWTEPEKFDPERFTPEEKAKRPALCHIPFGWGPRNCIGMRFAVMEAKMALMEILKKYSFVQAPETEVPLKTVDSIVTSPKNGVHLRMASRD